MVQRLSPTEENEFAKFLRDDRQKVWDDATAMEPGSTAPRKGVGFAAHDDILAIGASADAEKRGPSMAMSAVRKVPVSQAKADAAAAANVALRLLPDQPRSRHGRTRFAADQLQRGEMLESQAVFRNHMDVGGAAKSEEQELEHLHYWGYSLRFPNSISPSFRKRMQQFIDKPEAGAKFVYSSCFTAGASWESRADVAKFVQRWQAHGGSDASGLEPLGPAVQETAVAKLVAAGLKVGETKSLDSSYTYLLVTASEERLRRRAEETVMLRRLDKDIVDTDLGMPVTKTGFPIPFYLRCIAPKLGRAVPDGLWSAFAAAAEQMTSRLAHLRTCNTMELPQPVVQEGDATLHFVKVRGVLPGCEDEQKCTFCDFASLQAQEDGYWHAMGTEKSLCWTCAHVLCHCVPESTAWQADYFINMQKVYAAEPTDHALSQAAALRCDYVLRQIGAQTCDVDDHDATCQAFTRFCERVGANPFKSLRQHVEETNDALGVDTLVTTDMLLGSKLIEIKWRYSRDVDQSVYVTQAAQSLDPGGPAFRSIFTPAERLDMLQELIQEVLDLGTMTTAGLCETLPLEDIDRHFAQRQLGMKGRILDLLKTTSLGHDPSSVRYYFGTASGLYFGFMNHVCGWIYGMAVLGTAVFVAQIILESQDASKAEAWVLMVFVAIATLWGYELLQVWQDRERSFSEMWGENSAVQRSKEIPHHGFREILSVSSITGGVHRTFAPRLRWLAVAVHFLICFVLAAVCVLLHVLTCELRGYISDPETWEGEPVKNLEVAVCVISAVQIQVFNWLGSKLANALTRSEDHATATGYTWSLALKLFAIRFSNTFSLFIYIAFVKQHIQGCIENGVLVKSPPAHCAQELRVQLDVVFACQYVINLLQLGFPLVAAKNKARDTLLRVRRSLGTMSNPKLGINALLDLAWSHKWKLTPNVDPHVEDYAEWLMLLGYMVLFLAVEPGFCVLGSIVAYVLLRLETYKVGTVIQRPIAGASSWSQVWTRIFTVLIDLGALVNAAVCAFTFRYCDTAFEIEDMYSVDARIGWRWMAFVTILTSVYVVKTLINQQGWLLGADRTKLEARYMLKAGEAMALGNQTMQEVAGGDGDRGMVLEPGHHPEVMKHDTELSLEEIHKLGQDSQRIRQLLGLTAVAKAATVVRNPQPPRPITLSQQPAVAPPPPPAPRLQTVASVYES
mmetsp:Transcript_37290/g.89675  ORF Transcript_37290/g.89675 Transcript_37290/m.89675 type:complete len:1187 (-) Transcript_37290:13-3573(-)